MGTKGGKGVQVGYVVKVDESTEIRGIVGGAISRVGGRKRTDGR